MKKQTKKGAWIVVEVYLTARQRVVFSLRHYGQLATPQEIARHLRGVVSNELLELLDGKAKVTARGRVVP